MKIKEILRSVNLFVNQLYINWLFADTVEMVCETRLSDSTLLTIGKNDYTIKSVFTDSGKTLNQILIDLAQSKAFKMLNERTSENETKS